MADFEVTDVQVFNGYVLHIGHLKYGRLEVGSEVLSCYDEVCLMNPRVLHLTNLNDQSLDDGRCVVITLRHIFLIIHLGRFLEITSTNEVL